MKKNILFILFFSLLFSLFSFSQEERRDEVREKPKLFMTGFSDKLSNVAGWSLIESKEGKFWVRSDSTSQASFLPAYHGDHFEYMQMFQFSYQGLLFHFMLIQYDYSSRKIFAIRNNSIEELKNVTLKADGQYGYQLLVDYCSEVDGKGIFNPDPIIYDKEMIKALILQEKPGTGDIFSTTCKGSYLFGIRFAVTKADTVARFLMLNVKDKGMQSRPPDNVRTDYFEISKKKFEKLFKFSPWSAYKEQIEKEQEILRKQDEQIAKENEIIQQQDKQKLEVALKLVTNEVSDFNNSGKYIERLANGSAPPVLLNGSEDLMVTTDGTTFKDGEEFDIIVGAKGNVISTPKQLDFFNHLNFKPGTIEKLYYTQQGKFAVNTKVRVSIQKELKNNVPVLGYNLIKLKVNKSRKEGIKIENTLTTDSLFMKEIMPKINLEEEFQGHSNTRWYFNYVREYIKWKVWIETNDVRKPVLAGIILAPSKDWKKNVIFDPSNPDQDCP